MSDMSVKQAYSLLVALKNNLPGSISVDQSFVTQFDSILDTLEKASGQKLDAYRVPGSEMRTSARRKNTLTGETSYGESPECTRALLMTKIDALLGLFTIEGERKTIGFSA